MHHVKRGMAIAAVVIGLFQADTVAAQPVVDERVAPQVVRAGGDPFGDALLVDRQAAWALRRLMRVELLGRARAELEAEVDRLLEEAKRRRLLKTNRSLLRTRDRLAAERDDLRR